MAKGYYPSKVIGEKQIKARITPLIGLSEREQRNCLPGTVFTDQGNGQWYIKISQGDFRPWVWK